MKICILAPFDISKLSQYLTHNGTEELPHGLGSVLLVPVVKYYLAQGHEVVICTLGKDVKRERIYRGRNLTVFIGRYGQYAKINAATLFYREIRNMLRFLKSEPCDLYHAHWSYEFAKAALMHDANKTLITLHDWAPIIKTLYNNYFFDKHYEMNEWVCKRGRFFTTVSPYIQAKFEARFQKSIAVIPNSISSENGVQGDKPLHFDSPIFVMLNNGFTSLKNTQVGMQAFAIIKEQLPNATLYMYGHAFEPNGPAHCWAKQQNLDHGISFMGFCEHTDVINRVLPEADMLLHTSLEESFGIIFIEAMLAKTLSLGGKDSGAVSWVLDNGRVGLLADIRDPQDVAHIVLDMLSQPDKCQAMQQKAYQYVIDRFSAETVSQQYLDYYNNMLYGATLS